MTPGGWSGSSETTRRDDLPPNWEALRKAQLEKDGYRCTWSLPSGARCPNAATDVDHWGKSWEHHKLRSLCGLHHKKRTAKQGVQARRPPPPRRPKEQHPGTIW